MNDNLSCLFMDLDLFKLNFGDIFKPLFHANSMKTIELRNKVNRIIYSNIIRPICFKFDSERIHNLFILFGRFLGSNILTKKATSLTFNYQNKRLEQTIKGVKFRNPVGLSAGFDKNAEIINIMEDVGFGFVEVGSITAKQCTGNPGKRIDRIVEKKSLWINLGLNNFGADKIYNKLRDEEYRIPVGISIAKTNCKETADADIGIKDYLYSLKKLNSLGDYFTINISCPNSYGGQPFSDSKSYERLLKEIDKLKISKPIFVKLSPDLGRKNIDSIIKISEKHRVDGFVISNLTKKHSLGNGGLSGKVLEKKANELLSYVYNRTRKSRKKFILIGVGGIFSAEDAYKKIKLGANLVQLITGMIYEGPSLIGEINYELTILLRKEGYRKISEAVGKEA